MTDIFIFRHGETDWNRQGLAQGSTDIPLNSTGRQQAQQLAAKLANTKIEVVLSSDLSRAYETGSIVANALKVPIIKASDLREISLGTAEGTTIEESIDAHGEILVRRMMTVKREDLYVRYPGGENKATLIERTHHAIHKFVRTNNYTCIGVSTHGTVVKQLASSYMTEARDPVPIPNCVVYQLRFDRNANKIVFCGEFNEVQQAPIPAASSPAQTVAFSQFFAAD